MTLRITESPRSIIPETPHRRPIPATWLPDFITGPEPDPIHADPFKRFQPYPVGCPDAPPRSGASAAWAALLAARNRLRSARDDLAMCQAEARNARDRAARIEEFFGPGAGDQVRDHANARLAMRESEHAAALDALIAAEARVALDKEDQA
jgi:hypothetical protein